MRKYAALKSDFERENRAKKLEAVTTDERVDFDIMQFLKCLKVLRVEFEPAVYLHRLYKCIIQWKNPGLSMLVIVTLLLVAYFDVVHHIPALLLIANGLLLVSCRRDLEGTLLALDRMLAYAGFDSDDFEQEKLAAEKYANRKYGKIESEKGGDGIGLLGRLKAARHQFSMTRFSMGFHQKKLVDLSVFLGRFRTIYKWDLEEKSQIFCLLSLGLGTALLWLPLRLVFSVCVLGLFFKHNPWRAERDRTSKGWWIGIWNRSRPISRQWIATRRMRAAQRRRTSKGRQTRLGKREEKNAESGGQQATTMKRDKRWLITRIFDWLLVRVVRICR